MPDVAPKRIVVDARYLGPSYSGIGNYSRLLLTHLARLDAINEYHVLVRQGFSGPLELGPRFQIHPVDAAPLSPATLASLHRTIHALRPDLLHVHFPVIPPRYRGRLIVTVHDLQPLAMPEWSGGRPWPLPSAYRAFYRWMYRLAFERADRLLTVSRTTREQLIARFPQHEGKTIAIAHGFEPMAADDAAEWESIRGRFDLPARYVLYLGSTRPNKNLPRMLKAFARFLRRSRGFADIGFVLVLSPDRFLREVEQAIADERIAQNVRILPQVDAVAKAAIFRRALGLFFVTRLEGFGFPILEAQAAGVPVLTSNCDAAPEVAGDGALLVGWDDIEAQAAGLERLVGDEALRAKLVEAGRANTGRFSWEAAARRTLEVYGGIA
jgi:alpha-1,3-rhamnosyl/mannosyltransferase